MEKTTREKYFNNLYIKNNLSEILNKIDIVATKDDYDYLKSIIDNNVDVLRKNYFLEELSRYMINIDSEEELNKKATEKYEELCKTLNIS